MTNIKRYDIKHAEPHTGDVANHYPLRRSEIFALLEEAVDCKKRNQGTRYTEDERITINTIQIRLGQGVRGLTCPYQLDGPIAEAHNAIDQLYVTWLQSKDRQVTEELVREFERLMDVPTT